jgi:hypothetical protein
MRHRHSVYWHTMCPVLKIIPSEVQIYPRNSDIIPGVCNGEGVSITAWAKGGHWQCPPYEKWPLFYWFQSHSRPLFVPFTNTHTHTHTHTSTSNTISGHEVKAYMSGLKNWFGTMSGQWCVKLAKHTKWGLRLHINCSWKRWSRD